MDIFLAWKQFKNTGLENGWLQPYDSYLNLLGFMHVFSLLTY